MQIVLLGIILGAIVVLLRRAWRQPSYTLWMCLALLFMAGSGTVQRFVEKRRVEENLTWTDPQNKDALEIGFLAMGGFRGLLADILWVRATRLQDSARYYELKLLCDLIQKLQPTFTTVHAFQAFNMSYNLARRSTTCEDKFYWIRSGISTLERGLERNKRNYSLWFELGFQYMDRLGDVKMEHCKDVRQAELANIDDLNEAQREKVFSDKTWTAGRARKDEHLRWAAYYYYKATQCAGDPLPLRTERLYGHCIDALGQWYPSRKPEGQRETWEDWGSEDWWVELRRRNKIREMDDDTTVPENLRWCMYQQMDFYEKKAATLAAAGDPEGETYMRRAQDAERRFRKYFPEEKKSTEELMAAFRKKRDDIRKRRGDPN